MIRSRLIFVAILGFASVGLMATSAHANDVSAKDKRFMEGAAQAGEFEIEGSKLAEEKANSPEVKKFAQHIIKDHTKAATELKALAVKKGVELPAKPSVSQRASLALLGTHSGTKFDESYSEKIGLDAHKSAVADFTEAARNANDPDIKAFAKKTLPTLQMHLDMAKDLAAKTEKTQ